MLMKLVLYVYVCDGELWFIMEQWFAWDDVAKSLLCLPALGKFELFCLPFILG